MIDVPLDFVTLESSLSREKKRKQSVSTYLVALMVKIVFYGPAIENAAK